MSGVLTGLPAMTSLRAIPAPQPDETAMRLIRPEDFLTQPWKNGGGITHEIAREDRDGRLLWRLSIAEVASDGPFSAFAGLSRILTVIDGAGIALQSPGGALMALPMQPLAFSGDLPIDSRLIGGPVRDFNLIFDGAQLTGSVAPVAGDTVLPAGPVHAILALSEGIAANATPIPAGAVAVLPTGGRVEAMPQATGLLVALSDQQAIAAGR